MTTDADKCRRILETVQKTGLHVTVTFNYRYATERHDTSKAKEIVRYNPVHELVKRTIAEGKIGKGKNNTSSLGYQMKRYHSPVRTL